MRRRHVRGKQRYQFLCEQIHYWRHQPLPKKAAGAPVLLHDKLYLLSSGAASVPPYSRS